MRPATFTTVLLASLFVTVPVMAGQLYTLNGRDTTDTCNNVNAKLTALAGLISVTINQCLCLNGVNALLSGSLLTALINVLGINTVKTQINSLITGTGARTCIYPTNSVAQCTPSNVCAFQCASGFILCNGQCIASTTGICPSSVARRRRSLRGACQKDGEVACGILGRGQRAWECINTQTDLESCGGCMISILPHVDPPTGRDCSTIPHVANVGCVAGKCQIESCNPGYKPSIDGELCVPVFKKSYDIQTTF